VLELSFPVPRTLENPCPTLFDRRDFDMMDISEALSEILAEHPFRSTEALEGIHPMG
jgi:hypothetical protein